MTPDEQERLKYLKAQTVLKRHRTDEGRYLRPLLPMLRERRIRCSRIAGRDIAAVLGPVTGMAGRDDRLDWSSIAPSECNTWNDLEQRDQLFCRAIDGVVRPRERLAVVWHTHFTGLFIREDAVRQTAGALLDAAPLLWLVSADSPRWIIEAAHFDREVCIGRFSVLTD